jgi:hypothetical protein
VEAGFYSSWPVDGRKGARHAYHEGLLRSAAGACRTTVDALTEKYALNPLSLIKLDVDGHELDVLQGASHTLSTDHPVVIIELAPYTIEERGQDPYAVIELLKSHGYIFSTLAGDSIYLDRQYLENIPRGAGLNVIASHPDARPRGDDIRRERSSASVTS